MLIFLALLYFLLACTGIWLVFFPAGRDAVATVLQLWRRRADRGVMHWQGRNARRAGAFRKVAGHVWRTQTTFLRHKWRLFALAAPLILVPIIVALLTGRHTSLPAFQAVEAMPDAQIAALLQGEQLVPPTSLPPLAFSTQEVELVRPMLASASRNWGLLHPEFSQRLLMIFKIMKEQHGYDMAILEGYRSPARQDLLASMGGQVTNARAFQSWHQYGLAADCAFLRDGKLVISEKDPWAMRGYQLYGEVAESLGMTWGGRWKMMDFGHAELRMRGVMQRADAPR
ncbi:MAG: M15 family metallopeptidase [Pseudomonadota bacterium]|nr:M15 family metallopeptidase [Pseudomonadota bacterium]